MEAIMETYKKTTVHAADPGSWLSKHWDYMLSYANLRLQNEDLAKDLVQDTFLSALEKVDRFEGRCLERTWLVSILKNKIADVYRKKTITVAYGIDKIAEEDSYDFSDSECCGTTMALQHRHVTYSDVIAEKEFDHILQNYMQGLPELWSSVFTMKHLEDQSTKTICSELNVTASHCWVIMHRIKNNFRQYLEQNWN